MLHAYQVRLPVGIGAVGVYGILPVSESPAAVREISEHASIQDRAACASDIANLANVTSLDHAFLLIVHAVVDFIDFFK